METIGEFLDIELFHISEKAVTLGTLLTVVFILLAAYLISFVARKALQRMLARDDPRSQGALRAMLRLLHYLILLIGFGVAMETLGVSLTTLLATGALFAVGLGFAMQNIVQNFVSGVILLFENSIKPNDVLEVEGRVVKVVRLGIRSTVARTLDEEDIIIPNATLVQNPVKNYTMADSMYRLRSVVGVTYDSDMQRVREVLEKTAAEIPWRLKTKDPRVLMTEFGNNSVNFDVSVWIEDPWKLRQLKSKLNDAVWWALKEACIVIAFPQLDVHFDEPAIESIGAAAGRRASGA